MISSKQRLDCAVPTTPKQMYPSTSNSAVVAALPSCMSASVSGLSVLVDARFDRPQRDQAQRSRKGTVALRKRAGELRTFVVQPWIARLPHVRWSDHAEHRAHVERHGHAHGGSAEHGCVRQLWAHMQRYQPHLLMEYISIKNVPVGQVHLLCRCSRPWATSERLCFTLTEGGGDT